MQSARVHDVVIGDIVLRIPLNEQNLRRQISSKIFSKKEPLLSSVSDADEKESKKDDDVTKEQNGMLKYQNENCGKFSYTIFLYLKHPCTPS